MEREIIKCECVSSECPVGTTCHNEILPNPSKHYPGYILFYQHWLFINHITNKTYSCFQQMIRETKRKSNSFLTLSKEAFTSLFIWLCLFVCLFLPVCFFNHRISSTDLVIYKCKLKSRMEALPY